MMDRTVTTTIDEGLCTGCGLCVQVCPKETLTMKGKKAAVTGDVSLNCGHCQAACPTGAIRVSALDPALSAFRTFQPKESWMPFGEGDVRDLVNLMQSRRSCRNFTDKPVDRDILEDLVKIGISAPSGSNCQEWTFTLLPDRSAVHHLARMVGDFYAALNRTAEKTWLRKGLSLLGKPELEYYFQNHYKTIKEGLDRWDREGKDLLFYRAAAAIVVGSRAAATCPAEDALLATQNILLAAHVLGLGSCLIGFAVTAMKRERSIVRRLGLQEDEVPYAVIALGYPNEKYQRPAGRRRAVVRYFSGD